MGMLHLRARESAPVTLRAPAVAKSVQMTILQQTPREYDSPRGCDRVGMRAWARARTGAVPVRADCGLLAAR